MPKYSLTFDTKEEQDAALGNLKQYKTAKDYEAMISESVSELQDQRNMCNHFKEMVDVSEKHRVNLRQELEKMTGNYKDTLNRLSQVELRLQYVNTDLEKYKKNNTVLEKYMWWAIAAAVVELVVIIVLAR